MPDPSTVQLLADAKLVAEYGARSGRLSDDRLTIAISATELALANNDRDLQLNALIAAMNRVVQAIAPVTLKDLGSTWQPFPNAQHPVTRLVFMVVAVVVIILTGYYTQLYTQTNAIMGQLTDIQSRNEVDKSERLYRFFVANYTELFSNGTTSANAAAVEQYLQSYEDLRSLDDDLTTYLPLSCDVTTKGGFLPFFDWLFPKTALTNLPADLACSNVAGYYASLGSKYKATPASLSPLPPNGETTAAGTTVSNDDGPWEAPLSSDQQQMNDFLYKAGIPDAVTTANTPGLLLIQIYKCQQLVAQLGIWWLPFLYGIFGAAVFQMRAILNPSVPDPEPVRLFLRLALGGFAGVIFLLMFGSSPYKITDGGSALGVGSFGLAFLLGFSVDIFFSILDRLVSAVSQSLIQTAK